MRERRRQSEALIDAIARRYGQLPSTVLNRPMAQLAVDLACFRSGVDVEKEQQDQEM